MDIDTSHKMHSVRREKYYLPRGHDGLFKTQLSHKQAKTTRFGK